MDLAREVEDCARSVATSLGQDIQQPVSQLRPETSVGLVLGISTQVSQKKYHEKLKCDGIDTVRAIILLRPEDFPRYDMPFGHRAQLVHHAKETLGLK